MKHLFKTLNWVAGSAPLLRLEIGVLRWVHHVGLLQQFRSDKMMVLVFGGSSALTRRLQVHLLGGIESVLQFHVLPHSRVG